MRTSYSALDTYKICPLKYKYQEIDKIKTPKRIEAVFGSLIHSALKFMFERGPLYPSLDEIIDFFTRKFNEKSENIEWPAKATNDQQQTTNNKEEERKYYEEGVKIIKNFYKKNKPWDFNAVELESRFSTPLKDPQTKEIHTLNGIIDRLDKNPQTDDYEIIDYKTGKKMPSQESLEENLQLGLYHFALSQRWPNLKPGNIKTSLYFLKHNEKITATPTSESVARARVIILERIKEIEQKLETGEFPPTPGPLCNWCGYKKICPMWSHEFPENIKDPVSEEEMSKIISEFFKLKEETDKNKKRLLGLRSQILDFMKQEKLERVFGNEGYITKNVQERFNFNMEKIKPILEKIGKWTDILLPDSKKLEELLSTIAPEKQEEILNNRDKKEVITLKQSKNKDSK